MKVIVLICALLLCIAFVSAEVEVESDRAIAYTYPGQPEFKISTRVVGTWVDGSRGNLPFTQYDVTVSNLSTRNLKNFFLITDYTFRVRDGTAYWNVVRLQNGDLTLPSYQNSINAGANYTFGYILQGTPATPARLSVRYLVYQ
ncbi:cellulose-binding domain-containing protein [Heterostelium album PN500]|uniref:Cellulose-binding domain-containing protein n=1 Tax=Heterostelium pallidum (strain ATCC 26659 / Pp 5 / PN500) TaxID=670386 RepID=D3BSA5_HETP5|nr:cellulose-binding domain-containing protein [Heterostelium album PN500]EFA75842.1 cellulose-binding domain-containing protein [Heterostelium album PN500]|eukprot:XP_020427976.1 cellulose-binding domain-containing protein [Heterostelium album PN500]